MLLPINNKNTKNYQKVNMNNSARNSLNEHHGKWKLNFQL